MDKIGVGVIGVGAMGYNHARIYSKLDETDFIGVSDLNDLALSRVSKKYDITGYKNYEDLLNNDELQIVSVCVPTTHHYNVTMKAIEYGKDVLVEKPISFTLEEAKEMINFAKEKGVKLSIGHVERFNPAVKKAKELIENDVIGDVVSSFAKRVGPFPPQVKDVGVATDLAIHDLDVMAYLFNKQAKQIYATMGSILENCIYEDHAEIMTIFETGISGILEVNWLTPYKRRELEITGTEGIISINYINQSIDVHGKFANDVSIKQEEPLKEEIRSFLNAVKTNTGPIVTGKDGINALKMVLAANRSSKEKVPISISDIK
ncbi:MAG: Gfo/Idh/MocA family oxidoreductase [Methanobrevibacter sp.]|nr:Gfo/Idh/MocA family oxidoreductase [Candidatus Methanovirga aequatorialis]